MAIEIDVRVIGETAANVVHELMAFASRLSVGLGAAPTPADTEPEPTSPPEKVNGAEPAKAVKAKKVAAPAKEPEQPKLDRAAIIDGLTKIYSKGDEDVRLAITKFRDGQGADRLRDLKDDALLAANELLIELKTAAEQSAV
jgi:hypothetical protein